MIFALEFLSVLPPSHNACADSPSAMESHLAQSPASGRVKILKSELRPFVPSLPTFVITHGMGGTQSGDRFHQLASAIEAAFPGSNVILLDWSEDARRTTSLLGLPAPWEVAKNIDPVAKEAAECLRVMGVDPTLTTLIGESFGNCVNARIAEHLGRQGRILAFNPPNAAGGYKTPDLRTCAELTWSFQTFSAFDTQDPIAHVGFFLETRANATDRDQHIAGVSWLADQVQSGDVNWLLMAHQMTDARDGEFDAVASLSGEFLSDQHPTREQSPEVRRNSRDSATLVTSAL
jgi:hypothetical protein